MCGLLIATPSHCSNAGASFSFHTLPPAALISNSTRPIRAPTLFSFRSFLGYHYSSALRPSPTAALV